MQYVFWFVRVILDLPICQSQSPKLKLVNCAASQRFQGHGPVTLAWAIDAAPSREATPMTCQCPADIIYTSDTSQATYLETKRIVYSSLVKL